MLRSTLGSYAVATVISGGLCVMSALLILRSVDQALRLPWLRVSGEMGVDRHSLWTRLRPGRRAPPGMCYAGARIPPIRHRLLSLRILDKLTLGSLKKPDKRLGGLSALAFACRALVWRSCPLLGDDSLITYCRCCRMNSFSGLAGAPTAVPAFNAAKWEAHN